MAFWIFKCNPQIYQLEAHLADPNPTITWTVTRYRDEIQAEDTVFLWATGADRGIRAMFRVDAPPRPMAELDSEQAYWKNGDTRQKWHVIGTLSHRDIHLSHTLLRQTSGLEGLSVFHGFQQATNFRVTSAEGAILMRLIQDEEK